MRRCGLCGYLEPVENSQEEFLGDVSRGFHDTNSFVYDSHHILTDFRANSTTIRSMSLAGDTIHNSRNAGSYLNCFGTWNKVNVTGLIKITPASYTARIDLKNDKILLRSGLACHYSDTSSLDVEDGLTFWDSLEIRDCIEYKLKVLYEGNTQALTATRNNATKIILYITQRSFRLFNFEWHS